MTDSNTEKTGIQVVADRVSGIKAFDPGLGSYNLSSLGDAVQFSDLMAKADVMIPAFMRNKPAICLAVTMRALQWKMDPFAVAMEAYQAKDGGPVGYQAKVFVAALESVAGIILNYRYEGELQFTNKPVMSGSGKQIAPRGAYGTLRCIAFATIGGALLEYETPTLDEIQIKNSPGWHNTPRDQLAYYAGRGWARRYKPGVIMGAYSVDETAEFQPTMRDVTPAREVTGLAAFAAKAREQAQQDDAADDPADASTEPNWTASIDTEDAFPGAGEWDEGVEAFKTGIAEIACPYREDDGKAVNWLGGWRGAKQAQEVAE